MRIPLLLAAVLTSTTLAYAGNVDLIVGTFSFQGDGSSANWFEVDNDTGANSLLGLFPVETAVNFSGMNISYLLDSAAMGTIGPFGLTSAAFSTAPAGNVTFALTTGIQEAVITGTISPTLFTADLNDGFGPNLYQATSSSFSATLFPQSGNDLVPGSDFVFITVNATELAPEPGGGALMFAGAAVLLLLRRRFSRSNGSAGQEARNEP